MKSWGGSGIVVESTQVFSHNVGAYAQVFVCVLWGKRREAMQSIAVLCVTSHFSLLRFCKLIDQEIETPFLIYCSPAIKPQFLSLSGNRR